MAVDKTRVEGEKNDTVNTVWNLIPSIIMVLLGLCIFFCPKETILRMELYTGIALILAGAVYLKTYFSWTYGWNLALGLINIFVGIIFVTKLSLSPVTFHVIFGMWALFVGTVQLSSSSRLRNVSFRWSWTFAAGLLGIIFGFLIIGSPIFGDLSLTALMGIYLIAYGAMEALDWSIKKDIDINI